MAGSRDDVRRNDVLIAAEALQACGVRYPVGGSLGSAVSGEPRSTLDAALVVELTERDVLGIIMVQGYRLGPADLRQGRRPWVSPACGGVC
jgi:hypothetical protein